MSKLKIVAIVGVCIALLLLVIGLMVCRKQLTHQRIELAQLQQQQRVVKCPPKESVEKIVDEMHKVKLLLDTSSDLTTATKDGRMRLGSVEHLLTDTRDQLSSLSTKSTDLEQAWSTKWGLLNDSIKSIEQRITSNPFTYPAPYFGGGGDPSGSMSAYDFGSPFNPEPQYFGSRPFEHMAGGPMASNTGGIGGTSTHSGVGVGHVGGEQSHVNLQPKECPRPPIAIQFSQDVINIVKEWEKTFTTP